MNHIYNRWGPPWVGHRPKNVLLQLLKLDRTAWPGSAACPRTIRSVFFFFVFRENNPFSYWVQLSLLDEPFWNFGPERPINCTLWVEPLSRAVGVDIDVVNSVVTANIFIENYYHCKMLEFFQI